MEDENLANVEKFDILEPLKNSEINSQGTSENKENDTKDEKGEKKGWKFPTAYSILLIIQLLVFILTFIVPKGKYATILYDKKKGNFTYTPANPDEEPYTLPGKQETLDKLNISISFENFKEGYIKKEIAVPNSYERIAGQSTNFFELILNPITGMVQSADISFFLMILGGNINVLVEMKALTNGLHSLAIILKGRGFILLCIIMILVSIGGTTFGMAEETLAFYPILMPIFLKNGLDGMLSTVSMYSGTLIGTMFSTVNAFCIVIASYSAGISFSEGIWFRLIALIIGDILTIGFFYFYYRRIQVDETRSVCYSIKKELEDKFLKEEETKENENKNDEEAMLKDEKKTKNVENKEFTWIQIIALGIFICGFIIMIIGVVALNWWFSEMTSVFLVVGIILMICLKKEEAKAVSVFMKGVGDFASVSLAVGLARGINITLENGMIADTILNGLAGSLGKMNKILFAIVMIFIFIIIGIFIQSSSGLAVLSMPIFAPLAEEVNCSRALIVNAYMFGQNLSGFVTPTGLLLIILQLTGVSYYQWLKFIWPYVIIIFIYILILIMINTAF